MQGTTSEVRARGSRFILALVAAHVAAATFVVFAVAQLAPMVSGLLPKYAIAASLVTAVTLGVVVDVRAISKRWYSVGVPRQTPKTLLSIGEHAWVTPWAWGIDTGLISTTYRVSFCSWLLVLLALVGIAPSWAGLVYGLSFAIPLLAIMRFHHPSAGARVMPAFPAQVVGVASMLALAGVTTLSGSA